METSWYLANFSRPGAICKEGKFEGSGGEEILVKAPWRGAKKWRLPLKMLHS
jgi:hypothetical protein